MNVVEDPIYRLPFYYNGRARELLAHVFSKCCDIASRERLPHFIRVYSRCELGMTTDGTAALTHQYYSIGLKHRMGKHKMQELGAIVKWLVMNEYKVKLEKFTHTNTAIVDTIDKTHVTVKDLRYLYEVFYEQARRVVHFTDAERDAYTGTACNPFVGALLKALHDEHASIKVDYNAKVLAAQTAFKNERNRLDNEYKTKLAIVSAKIEYASANDRMMPAEEVKALEAKLGA